MTGVGSSCGACKFLRRRCTSECIFAPYFSYEQAATHFAAVHKVFGASNISKLLMSLPVDSRSDAALTMSYEALARMQDPVYGCVAHIFALQQQVACLKEEIETISNQISSGLGLNVAINDHEMTTIPYFVTQSSDVSTIDDHQPNFLHSGNLANVSEAALCSHLEYLQHSGKDQEEIYQNNLLDSSTLERLLQELHQDYYHYMHPSYTKNYAKAP